MDQGLADAKRVAETKREPVPTVLDSGRRLIQKLIPLRCLSDKPRIHQRKQGLSIHPGQLNKMKAVAVTYLRGKLEEYSKIRMSEMKEFADKQLLGTALKLKRRIYRSDEEIQDETFEQMRLLTLKILKEKIGADMSVPELKKYHEVHMYILRLKLKKLENAIKKIDQFIKKI